MYKDLLGAYAVTNLPAINLGGIVVADALIPESKVELVLKSFNRHGLIAGATGSGKTKTIQVLCEQLSRAGVPTLVMDVKGDLSGLAVAGLASDALIERSRSLGLEYTPRGYPTEILSLSATQPGVPLRASVESFGPVLFSRMLDINETQEGVIAVLFQYAKQNNLPLIDLTDLKSLLQFAQTERGKAQIEEKYGVIATTSLGTIVRKIVALETQGGNDFFGQPEFNVQDLLRTTANGLGIVSIIRLLDMQEKPDLFSTFMLKMLSDVYNRMPELGDPEKPKLVLFIDEAHLIFKNASKALLRLLDTIVKLIRSKGVGIIFCTQTPNDIPENILSQLGLKIQHTLRAFTAKDRTSIKLVAQNFPISTYYETDKLLTQLGIGEALLTALDSKGQPEPLIQCRIRAPESRMGVLTAQELNELVAQSSLMSRYGTPQQQRSAKDILSTAPEYANAKAPEEQSSVTQKGTDLFQSLSKNTLIRQIVRQMVRDWTRAIMKALGFNKGRK